MHSKVLFKGSSNEEASFCCTASSTAFTVRKKKELALSHLGVDSAVSQVDRTDSLKRDY